METKNILKAVAVGAIAASSALADAAVTTEQPTSPSHAQLSKSQHQPSEKVAASEMPKGDNAQKQADSAVLLASIGDLHTLISSPECND